ncbi:succinyl-CoA:3-ketoacid-coenzyme A transferase 1 mitochondrial precursor [Sarocladium strictum]
MLSTRSFSASIRLCRINKIYASAKEAMKDVKPGSTLLVGGFGFSGVPASLIHAIRDRPEVTDLTVVSNNAGMPGVGLGQLLETRQIGKMVASYIGENKVFEKMYLSGELDLELIPQGTLAEKCAAGAAGVPAFYTPAAYGTIVQTGELPVRFAPDGKPALMSEAKETRAFNGKPYLLEESIFGDVALVKAHKADRLGNCQFRKAQNNFNEAMGKNAKLTIVEVDELVEVGEIAPEHVHLPGVYVNRVIKSTEKKEIEKLTFAEEQEEGDRDGEKLSESAVRRLRIIKRASKELKDGMYVNLGIGMPLATPAHLSDDIEVILQSENGILGMGRYPVPGEEDPDLINPGKETVTLKAGASLFGSHESFGMIRAGQIDVTMLGALQVSANGDLANFMLPGKVKGIGGAMDLVANPHKTKVIVVMEHVDRSGNPKILQECSFPLTGVRCVSRIITDLAVFDVTPEGLVLMEVSEESSLEEVEEKTEAKFQVSEDLETMESAVAEIIKAEHPTRGDDTRQWGPPFAPYTDGQTGPGESAYFLSVNRNKKSLGISFKDTRGADILRKLASKADVLVENYLPGTLEKYGLDYEMVQKSNPALIYASITGYGQFGPYSDRAGFDVMVEAEMGLMHITGSRDGPPVKVGCAVTDLTTGMYAANSIMASLLERHNSGEGQHLDICLSDCQVATLSNMAQSVLITKKPDSGRWGTSHPSVVPYRAFKTSDGEILIGGANDRLFGVLAQLVDRPQWAADPRYASNAKRVENRDILEPEIEAVMGTRSTQEWLDKFEGSGLPYAKVNDLLGTVNHEHVRARNMIKTVEHPSCGPIEMINSPVKYSRSSPTIRTPPPLLGQHTDDILGNVLSLEKHEIAELRKDSVIS